MRSPVLMGAVLGMLALAPTEWPVAARAMRPEEALRTYLAAVYSHDATAAYERISLADRRAKTQEEYVRESGAFSGAALDVARALASHIRYEHVGTVITGDRATVTLKATLPNANSPAIRALVLEFDDVRLAARSPADRQGIVEKLHDLARSGRLPVIVGEKEQWALIREAGTWRVFLSWAGAVVVRFEAVANGGLPWEFAPVQPVVRAKPGETLHTFYRVRNLADRQTTGKARHLLDSLEKRGYVDIVSCFCFLQQTLDPGEQKLLPVVFRVNPEIPASISEVRVRYEFYPPERFPTDKTHR